MCLLNAMYNKHMSKAPLWDGLRAMGLVCGRAYVRDRHAQDLGRKGATCESCGLSEKLWPRGASRTLGTFTPLWSEWSE